MKQISEAEYQELLQLRREKEILFKTITDLTEEKTVLSKEQDILTKKVTDLAQENEVLAKEATGLAQEKEVLSDTVAELNQTLSSVKSQLEWFRKQMFGKKSEKNLPLNPDDLLPGLFDDYLTEEERARITAEAEALNAELEADITVEKHTRKRKVQRTLDISKLEVKTLPEILPEGVNLEDYVRISEEVTDKIIYEPAKMYIERTIRPRYVLKSNLQIQDPEKQAFEIAPLPKSILPKCLASSSLLSEIIVQKFLYHMPFYRILHKFKTMGLNISDSTLGDWYAAVCVKLKPLYDLLKEQALSSDYIQVDESTLRVIDNKNKRAFKGYVWVVRDALTGNVFFHYDKGSRSNKTALALLGNYRGTIQSDGYTSYDQFEQSPGKILLGCLVHARRKFADALSNDKKRASEGLMFFSKLYQLEKQAKEEGLSIEELEKLRREKAYPILQLFEKWLSENHTRVLGSSPIGKAITYTYALFPRLARYTIDGRYNPDNNLIESAIRPLAVGRKNWLHAGSQASATRACMIYSLIGSCKAANVEPAEWLLYTLNNITHSEDLSQLLPQNYKKL